MEFDEVGRALWSYKQSKTMKKCLTDVKLRLESTGIRTGVNIYLFGSILKNNLCPSDVDLLVVYDSQEDLRKIKDVLIPLEDDYPIDLLFASTEEEQELQLIKVMGAQPIL
jgi:predicted nucleotidyltransferase